MFHQRLILLLAVMALGFAALAVQLTRLTVIQGDEHRQRAEAKLVMREFSPTMRGRILDRHGRILAQDHPSFDVTVDFRVVNGEWAIRQAGLAARRLHGVSEWRKLSPQQRQNLIDLYVPIFQNHLDEMWVHLAEAAGVDEARIAARREEIVRRVEAMAFSVVARRVRSALGAQLAQGREISAETEDEVRRRVDQPLIEQRSPHIVLSQVQDSVGFALMRASDRRVDLRIVADDGRTHIATVPLLPELKVEPTGAREYPHEAITVPVDMSTMPGPIRREGALAVTVEGVAYHIIGRMKGAAQLEETLRRRERLNSDEAFRERVMVADETWQEVGGSRFGSRGIDRGEYRDDDPAGLAGVELVREDELRGLRGVAVVNLESGKRAERTPEAGRDVRLTLDIMLQARVQAIMSPEVGLAVAQAWHGDENPTLPVGTPLNGAAVVMDVDSGDVLALVSSPTVPRRRLTEDPEVLFGDPMNIAIDMPWIERATGGRYPPGSIAKALMVPAAVKLGRLHLDQTIECTGHLLPNQPNMYRCWIFRGRWNTTHTAVFGTGLNVTQSLMVSCNIYYYTLGQRLGPDGILDAYKMFGLGETWEMGTGQEFAGWMGPLGDQSRMRIGDAILMGIGQGPVAWSPLHAADAYATLARGGIRLRPRVIDDAAADAEPIDLQLDPQAIAETLKGLDEAVNSPRGTGHHVDIETGIDVERYKHFNAPGVKVWGKTGTAQAPTVMVKSGEPLYAWGFDDPSLAPDVRILRAGDHSWFVVMVGGTHEGRPRYVIAVMMEYAGSGGKVSGPIVNQIIHAMIAEGYL